MKGKASSLFQVAQDMRHEPIYSPDRPRPPLVCAKCEKGFNSVCRVKRKTKSGTYYYLDFRHLDHRKPGGYAHHYYRVPP